MTTERTAALIAVACVLGGCATTTTYTNPALGDDPRALKAALDRCDKAAQAACSPPGDGNRMCVERQVSDCMKAAGWTEK
jgi:uncharacterized protein YceK